MISRTTIKVPFEYLPTNNEKIPLFLIPLYEFIKKNLKTIGIFRINGEHNKVMLINEQLSQHIPKLPLNISIHDAASFLKLWLRELPIPIIPPNLISTYFSPDINQCTKDIIFHLTTINRKSLALVFSIIKNILNNIEDNQMNFENLSTCFFSSLTQNLKDIPEGFPYKSLINQLINYLNEEENDFLIINNLELLNSPKPRNCKTLFNQSKKIE